MSFTLGAFAVAASITTQTTSAERAEPPLASLESISSGDLGSISVPLREAKLHENLTKRNHAEHANARFRAGAVLFKRAGEKEVSVLRTAVGSEAAAAAALRARSDVDFATLDTLQTRQYTPSDANISFQWHHQVIGSFDAWETKLGSRDIRLAIVDTPFQMNHADLIDNVATGWDVTDELPILTSSGDPHSTGAAGIAAAVINNSVGIAGAANCRIVPIGITGATSEMYQAVLWAADHNIRVVNISWTGADEEVLQAAGEYLEETAQGILVMPGINGSGRLDYTNHPNVICVSMTDSADNLRSSSGPHIDFAAPGWDVYTTTTNNLYAVARGTSFAAPLFSGIAAMVMSINPALTAAQVIDALRVTAIDRGNPGWDESFGWGRMNFAGAVNEALKTLPNIMSLTRDSSGIQVAVKSAVPMFLTLERTDRFTPTNWVQVSAVNSSSNNTVFTDQPASSPAFYRVRAEAVHE